MQRLFFHIGGRGGGDSDHWLSHGDPLSCWQVAEETRFLALLRAGSLCFIRYTVDYCSGFWFPVRDRDVGWLMFKV